MSYGYDSILTYKALFFANRAKNTVQQAADDKKCTAATNAVRCTITASQAIVPLYETAKDLCKTSASNTFLFNTAQSVSQSNTLQNLVTNVTSPARTGAMKALSKMGIAGNIAYALGKCADASDDEKNLVFGQAFGNTGGMYLFEHCYTKVVDKVTHDDFIKEFKCIEQLLSKFPFLKSRWGAIIKGIGFVAASLTGCAVGEMVGKALDTSKNV